MPANILNLPCYKVVGIQENERGYHIGVEALETPASCPHCQSIHLVGFGRREQMAKDLPMHARRVGLCIDTRRFRCRTCAKTFYEALPEIDEKRLMTKRLAQWMGKQAIKRTFASIAEEVGCTEFTVRAVFNDYVNELEKTIRFETPKWMGIGEIHLIKPRGVIADIQNNTIVELLPNRNKDTVARFLHHLEDKERIQYVAMDMWTPYRDAVQAVLPDAAIVIDACHVVRLANGAMERVRKGLRESLTPKQRRGLMHDRFVLSKRERDLTDEERLNLDGWTKNYPALGEAYRLKEAFYAIYEESDCPESVMRHFDAWSREVSPETRPYFADLIRAFTNWQPFILNYFEHPVANACTESLNSLTRVMNRVGRGYSFGALRAKILFAEGAHKPRLSRPTFERKEQRQSEPSPGNSRHFEMSGSFARMAPKPPPKPKPYIQKTIDPEKPEKNYGVDISTLIRMIENGEL